MCFFDYGPVYYEPFVIHFIFYSLRATVRPNNIINRQRDNKNICVDIRNCGVPNILLIASAGRRGAARWMCVNFCAYNTPTANRYDSLNNPRYCTNYTNSTDVEKRDETERNLFIIKHKMRVYRYMVGRLSRAVRFFFEYFSMFAYSSGRDK